MIPYLKEKWKNLPVVSSIQKLKDSKKPIEKMNISNYFDAIIFSISENGDVAKEVMW
jgi:hypothetical protein